jgi:hypothetical protein
MKIFKVNLDDGTYIKIGPVVSDKWDTMKRLNAIGQCGVFDKDNGIYFPAHRVKNVIVEDVES